MGPAVGWNPLNKCPNKKRSLIMATKQTTLTLTALKKAARELNYMIGLDPPIDLKAGEDEIKEGIREAATLVDRELDDLSDSTWAVLDAVAEESADDGDEQDQDGADALGGDVDAEQDDTDAEEVDETEDADEDNGDNEAGVFNMGIFKSATKLADLKDIVQDYEVFKPLRKKLDEFKGLQGPKLLKAEMWKVLVKKGLMEAKEDASTKTKAEKKDSGGAAAIPTFTRIMAVAQVITKNGSLDKSGIIEKADALYANKTGRGSNLKETAWAYGQARQTLLAFGFGEANDKGGIRLVS
jgi:hypothetical protein